MVSSWAENSPTATTHRCTGSSTSSDPARKYVTPVSMRNPCAPSSRANLATIVAPERHSRRAVLGSPGLSPRDAPHHHDSIITARGKGTAAFSRSLLFPSHITWPHHTSPWLGGRRTVAGTPPPTSVLRHSVTRRRAVQHLSNELVEHIRRHRTGPAADEQTLSTDGQITHLAPSRCSMTAWAAAKRAIGTRNGEQET